MKKFSLRLLIFCILLLAGCAQVNFTSSPSEVNNSESFYMYLEFQAKDDIAGYVNQNWGYYSVELPDSWTITSVNLSYDNVVYDIPLSPQSSIPGRSSNSNYSWKSFEFSNLQVNEDDKFYIRISVDAGDLYGDYSLRSAMYVGGTWYYDGQTGLYNSDFRNLDDFEVSVQCASPYIEDGSGTCVLDMNTCEGNLPSGNYTAGPSSFLESNDPSIWTHVSSSPGTCEFTCDSGFAFNSDTTQCDFIVLEEYLWYKDADQDGFASETQYSTSDPGSDWYNITMPVTDCNDNNRSIHPFFTESGSALCTDGIDNDCNGMVDSIDPNCQPEQCEDREFGVIDNNLLYPPGTDEMSKLCLNQSQTTYTYFSEDGCGTDNTILYYDQETQLVSAPLMQNATYESEVCSQMNCYIISGSSCVGDFEKVLGLSDLSEANVFRPHVDSANSLCCQAYAEGLSFESGLDTIELMCSPYKDGFCPEQFEDSQGNEISCALVKDPDCGYQPYNVTSNFFRDLFSVNFDERVYVSGSSNTDNARVTIDDRNVNYDESTTFINYVFVVVSDSHSTHSVSEINFSYTQGTPEITFDNSIVAECDPIPSLSTELSTPCYEWDDSTLRLHHPLSVHQIGVNFTYRSLMTFILLGVVFALVIPFLVLFLVKTHALSHVKGISKKGVEKDISKITSFVERKLSEGISKAKIREMLNSVGWEDHMISLALHGVHTQKKNFAALRKYIKECIDKGVPKSKMFAALLASGWDKEEIEEEYEKLNK